MLPATQLPDPGRPLLSAFQSALRTFQRGRLAQLKTEMAEVRSGVGAVQVSTSTQLTVIRRLQADLGLVEREIVAITARIRSVADDISATRARLTDSSEAHAELCRRLEAELAITEQLIAEREFLYHKTARMSDLQEQIRSQTLIVEAGMRGTAEQFRDTNSSVDTCDFQLLLLEENIAYMDRKSELYQLFHKCQEKERNELVKRLEEAQRSLNEVGKERKSLLDTWNRWLRICNHWAELEKNVAVSATSHTCAVYRLREELLRVKNVSLKTEQHRNEFLSSCKHRFESNMAFHQNQVGQLKVSHFSLSLEFKKVLLALVVSTRDSERLIRQLWIARSHLSRADHRLRSAVIQRRCSETEILHILNASARLERCIKNIRKCFGSRDVFQHLEFKYRATQNFVARRLLSNENLRERINQLTSLLKSQLLPDVDAQKSKLDRITKQHDRNFLALNRKRNTSTFLAYKLKVKEDQTGFSTAKTAENIVADLKMKLKEQELSGSAKLISWLSIQEKILTKNREMGIQTNELQKLHEKLLELNEGRRRQKNRIEALEKELETFQTTNSRKTKEISVLDAYLTREAILDERLRSDLETLAQEGDVRIREAWDTCQQASSRLRMLRQNVSNMLRHVTNFEDQTSTLRQNLATLQNTQRSLKELRDRYNGPIQRLKCELGRHMRLLDSVRKQQKNLVRSQISHFQKFSMRITSRPSKSRATCQSIALRRKISDYRSKLTLMQRQKQILQNKKALTIKNMSEISQKSENVRNSIWAIRHRLLEVKRKRFKNIVGLCLRQHMVRWLRTQPDARQHSPASDHLYNRLDTVRTVLDLLLQEFPNLNDRLQRIRDCADCLAVVETICPTSQCHLPFSASPSSDRASPDEEDRRKCIAKKKEHQLPSAI